MFKAYDRVKVVNTGGADIEGMTGKILGQTFEHYSSGFKSYFVLFDEKIPNYDFPGLPLIQSILVKIE